MPALPSSSTPAAADLPPVPGPGQPLQRSGAVARMLGMPVATLRVWERRHGLTRGALTPGGQRLYTAEDVRRLALIRQLAAQGHAIGSLAGLGLAHLEQVAANVVVAPAPGTRPWRLVVVGQALGLRLKGAAWLQEPGHPVELLGPFGDLAEARAALAADARAGPADAWLLHQPQLHAGTLAEIEAVSTGPATAAAAGSAPLAVTAPPRPAVAVLYGYAAEAVCQALARRGIALLREPQPDVALAQWLRLWLGHAAKAPPARRAAAGSSADVPARAAEVDIAPRRWDDATLARFARMSSGVACECPRHLAELLQQLTQFESYSAQCAHASPADAALHAHLGRVAGAARTRFEQALEQVARHEGLPLPA